MKKAIAAAAVAAMAAGGVASYADNGATTAAKKPKDRAARCVTRGAETLVAGVDVRVYTKDLKDNKTGSRYGVYACVYNTGKRYLLGVAALPFDDESNDPSSFIRSVRISDDFGDGPAVAFVSSKCTATCTARVKVRSLRKGKTEFNLKAGGPFDQIALSQPTDQSGWALAWLETSPDGSCETGCRVHLHKRKGDKVLGEGTGIDFETFGLLADEAPGIISSGGSNSFIWKDGDTIKLSSFND
jgi:hypothetical protein